MFNFFSFLFLAVRFLHVTFLSQKMLIIYISPMLDCESEQKC